MSDPENPPNDTLSPGMHAKRLGKPAAQSAVMQAGLQELRHSLGCQGRCKQAYRS